MKPAWESPHGRIYRARAEDVYPLLEPGSVTLVHVDGPYGLQKAEWDRMKVSDLPDCYAPHIEAWGSLCAPSASVYLWNTAQGWAAIHPVMERAGWEFRALITWDKGQSPAQIGYAQLTSWIDVAEVCGCYTRGTPPSPRLRHLRPFGAVQVATGCRSVYEVVRSGSVRQDAHQSHYRFTHAKSL